MKNKKGFTLIELLAVIVILAVLVLLAVPSVLKTMDNARVNAFVTDANAAVKASQTYFVEQSMAGTPKTFVSITTLVSEGYLDKDSATTGCIQYTLASNSYTINYNNGSYHTAASSTATTATAAQTYPIKKDNVAAGNVPVTACS